MTKLKTLTTIFSTIMMASSCNGQESIEDMVTVNADQQKTIEKKPHRYGGWHCPDNFGFVPVDIQHLDHVPAIENRLPTEQELKEHKSLIKVDTEMYPDARALEMDLPRVGRITIDHKGTTELVIVIQAIVVEGDTVVGYRFPSGGNGSAWYRDVELLSEKEVADLGPQPYYFSKTSVSASSEEVWKAIGQTRYGMELDEKFSDKNLFSTDWNAASTIRLNRQSPYENTRGYAGIVFGNFYLQLDYELADSKRTEKILLLEKEDGSTELMVAFGPYSKDMDKQLLAWDKWVEEVVGTAR